MTSGKKQLDEEDFPLEVKDTSVTTKDGQLVATAQTPGLADDLARRLNDDALRRHEGNWSA
jgi:hypothetical protein